MSEAIKQRNIWAVVGTFALMLLGSNMTVSAAPAPPDAVVTVTCGDERVSIWLSRDDFQETVRQNQACDSIAHSLPMLTERVEAWYSSNVWKEWNRASDLRFEPYSAERLTEINDRNDALPWDNCLYTHTEQVGDWLEIRPTRQPYCNMRSYFRPVISLPQLFWHQLGAGTVPAIRAIGIAVAGFGLMTAFWFAVSPKPYTKSVFNENLSLFFVTGILLFIFISGIILGVLAIGMVTLAAGRYLSLRKEQKLLQNKANVMPIHK